jgi:hypothetical protein
MWAYQQAPKTKKLQGDTKFRTKIRNESDILEQFLYTRELVVSLSLICANNWQIQVLVKTVGGISKQQRILVVLCVSECVQKNVLPYYPTQRIKKDFFLFVDVWNRDQFIAFPFWMRHLIILPETDNLEWRALLLLLQFIAVFPCYK